MGCIRLFLLATFVAGFHGLSAQKTCYIKVPRYGLNVPIYNLNVGRISIRISDMESRFILLENGESFRGFCGTKFEPFKFYRLKNEKKLLLTERNKYMVLLKCIDNELHYYVKELMDYHPIDNDIFQCCNYEWSMYKVKDDDYWCSTKATSYVLVTRFIRENIILAKVCLKLEDLSLESIRYITTQRNFVLSQENLKELFNSPLNSEIIGVEIKHDFLTVSNEDLRQKINFVNFENKMFPAIIYQRDLIIQDGTHEDFFANYGKFLALPWWHNLLYGNWRQFTEAFKQQFSNVIYEVYMGASGAIKQPFQKPKHNETVPAYIWAYLRALNANEEIVVIGYNSPFFEFFDSKEIVFCKDICDEISWLKGISTTFRYSALGVIFCCTPENVRSAGILTGFPDKTKQLSNAENSLNYKYYAFH